MKNKSKILIPLVALFGLVTLSGCKGDDRFPRTFTVNFVTGEGGEEIASQTVKEGYMLKGASSPDHTREHIFRGWYTDANYENYFDVDTYRVFEDLTLYSIWASEA